MTKDVEGKVILHFELKAPEMPSASRYQEFVQESLRKEEKTLGTVSFTFVSDETLLRMNKTYLDHQDFTDILTFPYSYDPVSADIFISVDRVADNARTYNVSVIDELHRVMIHGLLHMCGWNDDSPAAQKAMRARETYHLDHWK